MNRTFMKKIALLSLAIMLFLCFGTACNDKEKEIEPFALNCQYMRKFITFNDSERSEKKLEPYDYIFFVYTTEKIKTATVESFSAKSDCEIRFSFNKVAENKSISGKKYWTVLMSAYVTPTEERTNESIVFDEINLEVTNENDEEFVLKFDDKLYRLDVFYIPGDDLYDCGWRSYPFKGQQASFQNFEIVSKSKQFTINSGRIDDEIVELDKEKTGDVFTNVTLKAGYNERKIFFYYIKVKREKLTDVTYPFVLNCSELGSDKTFDFPIFITQNNANYTIDNYLEEYIKNLE